MIEYAKTVEYKLLLWIEKQFRGGYIVGVPDNDLDLFYRGKNKSVEIWIMTHHDKAANEVICRDIEEELGNSIKLDVVKCDPKDLFVSRYCMTLRVEILGDRDALEGLARIKGIM